MRFKSNISVLKLLCILMVAIINSAYGESSPIFSSEFNSNGSSTQNNYQYYIRELVLNGTVVLNVSSNYDVVQISTDTGYIAYDKEDAQNHLPDGALNSFSEQNLRGYDGSSYQYVLLGRYRQEFAEEPILWRVLAVRSGKALLLSEYILDTRPFDTNSNKWIGSDIQSWLNSTFYHNAFSDMEKQAIYEDKELGRILLPSRSELTNPEYGFNKDPSVADEMRSASGSMYAFENNLWVVKNSDYTNYFARTAPNATNVDLITSTGKFVLATVTRDNVGIRPIITVNIADLPFTNGMGTIEYPYQ